MHIALLEGFTKVDPTEGANAQVVWQNKACMMDLSGAVSASLTMDRGTSYMVRHLHTPHGGGGICRREITVLQAKTHF